MEQSSSQADVESLQKSAGRRRSLVDFFLGVSVVILFVAVTALAVGGMLVVKELRSELRDPASGTARLVDSGSASSAYKMHNFAYLKAAENRLDNTTMSWRVAASLEGPSVGSNFQYDPSKQSLTPSKKGIYFMYIQVTVNCNHKCQAGSLKLEVLNTPLTCHVELTDDVEKLPVTKKCWTVTPLDSKDLITHMTVPKNTDENWSLDRGRSGLGVFLVE